MIKKKAASRIRLQSKYKGSKQNNDMNRAYQEILKYENSKVAKR